MDDLWKELALPCNEHARDANFQCTQNNLAVQGPIKIASLPLKQYKPEDISFHVDGENDLYRFATTQPPFAYVCFCFCKEVDPHKPRNHARPRSVGEYETCLLSVSFSACRHEKVRSSSGRLFRIIVLVAFSLLYSLSVFYFIRFKFAKKAKTNPKALIQNLRHSKEKMDLRIMSLKRLLSCQTELIQQQ